MTHTDTLTAHDTYREDVIGFLKQLTMEVSDRSTGSVGNHAATDFFQARLKAIGWTTETQSFEVIDWCAGTATLISDRGAAFQVFPSPYSIGCETHGPLKEVSTVEDLERIDATHALLLLRGAIARSPLLPKNFPFFTDTAQQRLIAALERCGAAALICATGEDGEATDDGAAMPMLEDGDFNIPSVFMTAAEGERLASFVGQHMMLISHSHRVPSMATNVIARINTQAHNRLVITAHIDARKNMPGALDNAAGVVTLLLLAKLLANYRGMYCLELVALNGEDHYAVPGQIAYADTRPAFERIALNINIDGVGYVEGSTAYSFFGLPGDMKAKAMSLLLGDPDAREGIQWRQGDHALFVQSGCPAIAVTSNWLLENMTRQSITHSMQDTMESVDPDKLVSCALRLERFITALRQMPHPGETDRNSAHFL